MDSMPISERKPDENPDETPEQDGEEGSDEISGAEPLVNQPGVSELRQTVANYLGQRFATHLPRGASLRKDALAGLSSAISNVPDGMANGVLVGVNPVYGLYATMMGPAVGGAFASTQLMLITTTAAASLSAGQALANLPPGARDSALFILVMLIGVFQVLFGLLKLGRFIRFVSYSVTTGFLTGVSVLLILNQLPVVTGYEATGGNKITQTIDLLVHLAQTHLPSISLTALTLVLALLLPRTPLGNLGRLVAIIVPSALVTFLGMGGVRIVRDVGEIPSGVPMPHLPSLSDVSFDLVTGALAVAAVILVQGSGVSQSVPNPDGAPRSTSRDFIAQGAANVASGLFRGLPVGGSLSATALNVVYGARTRWAAIFAGVWMALIVMLFPGLVSYIAMPALGALLILAGASSIKPRELRSIWSTGWPSRLALLTTFVSTLFLPIQVAVGIGVVLTAMLHLNQAAAEVTVVELVERPDGRMEERAPPKELPGNRVTVLDVYGDLFYAGARALERRLPSPADAPNPVVVLRLRGRTTVGATLVEVLANYAKKLQAVDGRLYLSGISKGAYEQIVRTGKLRLSGPVRAYEATPILGQSTQEAYADAQTWLASLVTEPSPDSSSTDGSSPDAPPQ